MGMGNYGLIDVSVLDGEIERCKDLYLDDDLVLNSLLFIKKASVSQKILIEALLYCVKGNPSINYHAENISLKEDVKYIFKCLENIFGITSHFSESSVYRILNKDWVTVVLEFTDCYIVTEGVDNLIVLTKGEVLTYDQYIEKFRAKYKTKKIKL